MRRLPAVDERDLTQPISSQLRATVFSGGDHRRLGVKPEGEHRATICVQSTWIADGNRQVEVKLLLVGQENGAHFPFRTGCRAEQRKEKPGPFGCKLGPFDFPRAGSWAYLV